MPYVKQYRVPEQHAPVKFITYIRSRTYMTNSLPEIPIGEYFRYHPPTTKEREGAHECINAAARMLAETIDNWVHDPGCKKMAFFAVQQARMFANQGVMIDELRKKMAP